MYITLPSTVQGPTNNTCDYTTQLAKPLEFKTPHEVALVEFIYRENFKWTAGTIFVTNKITNVTKNYLIEVFDNQSMESWLNILNLTLQEEKISFSVENKFIINLNNMNKSTIKATGWLEWMNRFRLDDVKVQLNTNEFDTNITHFNIIDYLMVYTDIINPQYIGDQYAPLLRCIAKSGPFNTTTEKIFIDPHYIPVNKSFINTINIDVREPLGEKLKFSSVTGKIIAKLHFRPIKNE